jgi:hypothetical protein
MAERHIKRGQLKNGEDINWGKHPEFMARFPREARQIITKA